MGFDLTLAPIPHLPSPGPEDDEEPVWRCRTPLDGPPQRSAFRDFYVASWHRWAAPLPGGTRVSIRGLGVARAAEDPYGAPVRWLPAAAAAAMLASWRWERRRAGGDWDSPEWRLAFAAIRDLGPDEPVVLWWH